VFAHCKTNSGGTFFVSPLPAFKQAGFARVYNNLRKSQKSLRESYIPEEIKGLDGFSRAQLNR